MMIPIPLPPASVEGVTAVVDIASCILALLHHSVPAAKDVWNEHLVFLDQFRFVN